MRIPFVGGSDQGRSLNINASRSINFFVETSTEDSKTPAALIGTPGTKTFIDFGFGPHRGAHIMADRCFLVVGPILYEIFDGSPFFIPRGTFPSSTGRVVMADNGIASKGYGGNQLLVVAGGFGYIYNVYTNKFSKITDIGFPENAADCTYVDGYFVVSNKTMDYYVSKLNDGLVWPGLAYDAAIANPDSIQKCLNLYNQLFLIKEYTTEIWYDVGVDTSLGSPFARVSGGTKDFGTPAPYSVARINNLAFLLANTHGQSGGSFAGVAVLNGYDMQVISTPAITYRISHFDTINDAFGYCYADEGHMFYVLTFPTEDVTFVYDLTTQSWHERSTNSLDYYTQHRHISETYVYFAGKHLVGSYLDGKLLEMSSEYYNDNGVAIVGWRTAQTISDPRELGRVNINKLILDVETGIGDESVIPAPPWFIWYADGSHIADGSGYAGADHVTLSHNHDPQAWLSWSNDGGHTWSSDYPSSLGKMGEYSKRLIWRRLGSPRNRIFRLKMADSTKRVILGAMINDGAAV